MMSPLRLCVGENAFGWPYLKLGQPRTASHSLAQPSTASHSLARDEADVLQLGGRIGE